MQHYKNILDGAALSCTRWLVQGPAVYGMLHRTNLTLPVMLEPVLLHNIPVLSDGSTELISKHSNLKIPGLGQVSCRACSLPFGGRLKVRAAMDGTTPPAGLPEP